MNRPQLGTCVVGIVSDGAIVAGADTLVNKDGGGRAGSPKVVAVARNVVLASCGLGEWRATGERRDGTPVRLDYSFLAVTKMIHDELRPGGSPWAAVQIVMRELRTRLEYGADSAITDPNVERLRALPHLLECLVAGFQGPYPALFRITVTIDWQRIGLLVQWQRVPIDNGRALLVMGSAGALDVGGINGRLRAASRFPVADAEREILTGIDLQARATPREVAFPVAVVIAKSDGISRLRVFERADAGPGADHPIGGYPGE